MPARCPPYRNVPFPGAFQGSHGSDRNKTKPQWLIDLYKPLDDQLKKALIELYDEESSEEEIFGKPELE